MPFLRPKKLSTKNSKAQDAIVHALDCLNSKNIYPEIIVVLLCNLGTHIPGTIDKCVNILKTVNGHINGKIHRTFS